MLAELDNLTVFKQSYLGQSLDEIIGWYPEIISKTNVLDYIIESGRQDALDAVMYYDVYHSEDQKLNDKIDLNKYMGGFFICMQIIEALARRFTFMLYAQVDNKELVSEGNGKVRAGFKISDFEEYENEMDGYKRFITRSEFEEFIKLAGNHKYGINIYDCKFNQDSLYCMLYMKAEEYGYDADDVTLKFLTDGRTKYDHPGSANDYLKTATYLRQRPNTRLITRDHLMYDFLELSTEF